MTIDIGQRLSDPHNVSKDSAQYENNKQKISATMTKLFRQPKNGGNPFLFAFTAPKPHELTTSIQGHKIDTAATDGRRYYWNPDFLDKLTHAEVDVVMQHEAYHTIFYHSERLRGCDKSVRNVALDYVVNAVIEVDHERNQRPGALFGGNIGEPLPFKRLIEYIDGKIEFDDKTICYADKTMHGRSPESIYDEIMKHWDKSPRKCPVCGALSLDPKTGKPKKNKQGKQQQGKQGQKGNQKKDDAEDGDGDQDGEDGQDGDQDGQCQGHGGQGQQGQQPGQGQGQGSGGAGSGTGGGSGDGSCCCPHCGAEPGDGSGDGRGKGVRGLPNSLDGHLDCRATKQEVQADTMKAVQQSTTMRGTVPAEVESLLGELIKPQIRFVDLVRSVMMRKRLDAGMKNDWKRFRKRYIAATPRQYLPKRHSHFPRWLCMLDTSGSMSDDDIAYGISQLQVLGSQTEGFVIPVDAEPHWEKITAVKKLADLKRTKVCGRGGTTFADFFRDYPDRLGVDFDAVIVITDGYCDQIPMEYRPRTDCVWVITSNFEEFKPTFGRVVRLREHRL